jgi:hypothetical protein
MKLPITLFIASTLASPLSAETVYTVPQGYTKITIPAASSASSPSLTAISATLLNDIEFSGAVTINADFNADPDTDPQTPTTAQTVTATGASFSVDQFTAAPHLAYLINGNGAEEAFLITSHTGDVLTVDGSFDLLAASRFTASSTVKIRKANTVGSILGTTATPFTSNDRAFIWNGNNWQTLIAANDNWFYIGGPQGTATNAVVFPEEGIFIQRTETTEAVLTLFGEVPSVAQASSVEGATSTFVSTRFPVGNSPTPNPTGIKLEELNIDDIPGWSSDDRVFYWTGTFWQTLISAGGNWFYIGGPSNGTNANLLLVPPNSALFLSRTTTGTASTSPLTLNLPYTLTLSQ